MEKFIADSIVYGLYVVLGLISIGGAIFKPALGIIICIQLAAFFFDYNRRVFNRFFISPKIFFEKSTGVERYHRLLFFVFSAALIVNLVLTLARLVKA